MVARDEWGIQRRVVGHHSYRFDGLTDLLVRARGMSVLDVGCNRGQMCHELMINGARLLHGCDNDPESIRTARNWFADFREVRTQFEVVDLSKGAKEMAVFKSGGYDLVLLHAVLHKLRRQMPLGELQDLCRWFGKASNRYVAARVIDEDRDLLDETLGFNRVHVSLMSEELGQAVIWRRP